MKKNNFLFPTWLTLLLLAGNACAKPEWIDEESVTYPHAQYVTATGSAAKAELAKDRALANLMKVFELKIQEESITRSDTQVNIADGEETVSRASRLQQQISVQTDKVIDGARIAETWHDEEVHTYHALAVLERVQAGNNIRQEMSRLDDETETELAEEKKLQDPLRRMTALSRALNCQQQRLSLQKMLKVIDLKGMGRSSLWSLAELQQQLEAVLQDIKISTAADKDPIGGVEKALQAAMGNAGLPATSGMGDFILVVSLDVQDLGQREGWYWLRGKLGLKMVETASGRIRGEKQWPLKVSALQQNETEGRLLSQVSKALNKDLKAVILSFATGTTQNK